MGRKSLAEKYFGQVEEEYEEERARAPQQPSREWARATQVARTNQIV